MFTNNDLVLKVICTIMSFTLNKVLHNVLLNFYIAVHLGSRYGVEIEATTGIGVPHIPPETLAVFRQHLDSFNDWALVGKNCMFHH